MSAVQVKNVAELMVECLEAEGITVMWGVPGEENEAMMFALSQSNIRVIATRIELGAGFAANVYGRLTGRPGVCFATLGPGATNLVTPVADAHLDNVPLLAIVGQGATTRLHRKSHQIIQSIAMYQPITASAQTIRSPVETTEIVRALVKRATLEKPAAVLLELPEDVAYHAVDMADKLHRSPIMPRKVRRASPDYKAVKQAAELIRAAKFPLVVCGNGALRSRASSRLREFCSTLGLHGIATLMGKGALDDADEHSLLTLFILGGGKDHAQEFVEQADLIITCGYDVAEFDASVLARGREKQFICLDFEPAEVHSSFRPEVELVGDIAGALWSLLEEMRAGGVLESYAATRPLAQQVRTAILGDIESYRIKDDAAVLTAPGLLLELRDALPSDGVLVLDTGMASKMWGARNFITHEPNTVLLSNGLATMGLASGGGMGAAIALEEEGKGRRCVAMCGDGAFGMLGFELETAKRAGCKFTMLVASDDMYGLIKVKEETSVHMPGHSASKELKLGNPDYKKFGDAFGITTHVPTSVSELRAALKESIDSNELRLIAVNIDPSVNRDLIEGMRKRAGDRKSVV